MSGILQGDDMPIKALAPWFGGKRNLAALIAAELGPHRSYFDPFCGGLSVLLAKPEASHENVNDLHGDIVNLARCVQHPVLGPALYRRLRRAWLSEETFLEVRARFLTGDIPDELSPDRAADFFILSWFGRNGLSGLKNYNMGFCARWTPNGGHGGKRFASAVDSIPAWRRRMRRVTILRRDALEFIGCIEDYAGVAIYCDPPYLVKGAKYLHDFADTDHQRLSDLLARFKKARVVVSYYEHPRLAELYPGWTKVSIEVSKAIAHQGSRGANDTKATEVLLINGPSYTKRREDPSMFAAIAAL